MVKVSTPKKRESVWTKNQPKGPKDGLLRELKQVPNTKSVRRDASRTAKVPGLRISKNGKKYWETRSNRSDKRGQKL